MERLGGARRRRDRLEREAKPTIRLVRPGMKATGSRLELDVPAGVFVSPEHAWVQVALNGKVRTGIDDLLRKLFGNPDAIDLPEIGRRVEAGQPLFTLLHGDHRLAIPAPVSGQVLAINTEHVDHPEWLSVKPFELSWICELAPSNLGADLARLRIGQDAVAWYQSELDRYGELADLVSSGRNERDDAGSGQGARAELLDRFTGLFLEPGKTERKAAAIEP